MTAPRGDRDRVGAERGDGRRLTGRRAATALVVLVLAAGAATGLWRSLHQRPPDAVALATQLRCLACQGESVAHSQSPMAAAMRQSIADQLAAGRTPDQVRQWFVERYGAQVLADPPPGRLGPLLWLVPLVVAAAMAWLALRTVRRRARRNARAAPRDPPPMGAARARRSWDVVAVALVAMIAAVAVAGPRFGGRDPAEGTRTESVETSLTAARSLERDGRYAEAATVYADVLRQRPDDEIRLRLAFALLRADRPAGAAAAAQEVLDRAPDHAQAVLMLGMAQRAEGHGQADATLRRFLTLAPDDPAAAQVRRLLSPPS
ncbi:cytochrome c-type biogenesis protein CcmH [Phytohabitans kaempferiae]|uniref:Cytochrome c-type biogenesis protein n=1 Tax=Phytohabitans kaempferiae TaxID=1620943 RepID=A0ABV6MAF5_9ACTN